MSSQTILPGLSEYIGDVDAKKRNIDKFNIYYKECQGKQASNISTGNTGKATKAKEGGVLLLQVPVSRATKAEKARRWAAQLVGTSLNKMKSDVLASTVKAIKDRKAST